MKTRMYLMFFLVMSLLQPSLLLQIPCQVQLEPGVQYRKLFWYKVRGSSSLTGLVMKDLHRNTTVLYKYANHSYRVGEDLSLLLQPEFREEHCETYRCSVWPPVGHSIRESDYSFPQGCQAPKPESAKWMMDMHTGLESSVYFSILSGILFVIGGFAGVLLLIGGLVLLYKRKEKYIKLTV